MSTARTAVRKGHILVVDEDPNVFEVIRYALSREGYQVTCAVSAERAVACAESDLPDLVIMELVLPDLDGLELCRRIQSYGDIPVLILTVRSEANNKAAAVEAGAAAFLPKPVRITELTTRIHEALKIDEALP
jgi:two-component system alkaline phosphatase synthesis response regulator PhoP